MMVSSWIGVPDLYRGGTAGWPGQAQCIIFRLGNILKKGFKVGSSTSLDVRSPSKEVVTILSPSPGMEITNLEEENKLMDFESDIDTWVIEKEELSLSSNAVQDKSRKDVLSFEMKSMNKENIKKFTSSSDRKALRCFRIHKSMGYQETTPESETDTKRKSTDDKEETFEGGVDNSKTSSGLAKKGKSNVTSFPNDNKSKNRVNEMKVEEAAERKKYKKKKFNKDQIRVTSLRQNLPSRKSLNAQENKSDIHGDVKSALQEESRLKKTMKNGKQRKTLSLKVKKKTSSKQNDWVVHNRKIAMLNSHNKMRKKLNKYQFCGTLNMSKIFCGGKALSPKDLLVEPVRFTDDNYVQCYYQSQQSPLQDHLDRHLRQSTLLSCRFCMYKTNSRQLLQRHTASSHTWDPALVSTLFS
ncbi:hypothetical protein J6590_050496 [Homalodisca vitripennis]|nr:hypothetical protein J6590_050496 [Homalodisca vitripennis]